MNTTHKIKVHIPEPCFEDWNEMTPKTGGRHCAACDKVVVDFTKFSDAELIQYFQKPNETTCGRFRSENVTTAKWTPNIPIKRWFQAGISFVLALFAFKASAQNQAVEVIALSGPGSEPKFDMGATDTTFTFTLVGGALAEDSGIQYIVVKRDIDVFEFERNEYGKFNVQIPRVWHDSIFVFSFFNKGKEFVGSYEIPMKDAWKYADSRVMFKTMPQVNIVRPLPATTTKGIIMGGAFSPMTSYYGVLPSVQAAGIPIQSELKQGGGKIPVHIPGKVSNGSQDLPGYPTVPASDLPKY